MLPILILTLLAIPSALTHIWAEYQQPKRQQLIYIFKPLTVVFIIFIALISESTVSDTYKTLIIIGLVFCIFGDIFLMLPEKFFIYGLVSFLTGHLWYIAAFALEGEHPVNPLWLLPLLAYGAVMLYLLWPHLGTMRGPVLFYMAVILAMGWQAVNRWAEGEMEGRLLAMIGALLFVFSDSVLALDRFRQPFRLARLLVLGTYFPAQWFIAMSI